MSSELRGTLHHPVLNIGFKGGSNWVEFLKTEIPSEASWAMSTENISSSAYPEAGYRLIRYELAMKNVIDTGLDNAANREMIENLNLDNNSDGAPGGDFRRCNKVMRSTEPSGDSSPPRRRPIL